MDGLASAFLQDARAVCGGSPPVVSTKKIAILGACSTSLDLAPWADESWTIWACSGATQPRMKRYDAFFELHDFDSCVPHWAPEFVQFLKSSKKPVYMHDPHPEIPAFVQFPRDPLIATFGRYFFTSSIAWMLAFALHEDAQEIGLWGVDMEADTEYASQRPGCQHFITAALHRGVTIRIPPESSIANPPPLYGCAPRSPRTVQAVAFNNRLQAALTQKQEQYQAAAFDKKYYEGYNDCYRDHVLRNLEQDPKSVAGG